MRKIYFLFLLFIFLQSCVDKLSTANMISAVDAKPDTVLADGSSIVYLTALLNNDIDQRNVMFKTDQGSFPDGKGADSIVVVAEKLNGQLTAVARLTAPSTAGTINVSTQIIVMDQKGKYVTETTITATQSIAARITLSADAFSVYNNFDGEINLTGKLSNSRNAGVSAGYKVVVDDWDNNFQRLTTGQFRNNSLTSNSNSQVTVTYTPGFISPGQEIYLIGTILNPDGSKSAMADTIQIAITQKH